MMMFGGSPHMVAAPPRLAQKTSEMIHGNGVKPQNTAQLQRYGSQKKHHSNAVDEHGKKCRHAHEAEQKRNYLIPNRFGQRKAQPAEKSGVAKAFHHYHHARNKEDGGPVDACSTTLRGTIPEADGKDCAQIQGVPDCLHTVHTQTKYQHQKSAGKSYVLTFKLVKDNQGKHSHKDSDRNDLSYHF
jgi:hypothetical protein